MEEVINANRRLNAACGECERSLQLERNKLDAEEKRLTDRLNDLNKKKRDIAAVNGDVDADDNDIVEINAGGKIIAAKRAALTQMKGTRIAALFSGRWDKKLQKDGSGRIFLDVNPVCFEAIVDFLNELTISSNDSPATLPKVDNEYRSILIHQLKLFGVVSNTLPDSNIITEAADAVRLYNWLEEDGSEGELRLLYRGSRDGFEAKSFQLICSNMGSTLTIIQTTENGAKGTVVGGYSNMPWLASMAWDYSYQHSRASKAFLFALSGGEISASCKLKLKNANDNKAITSYSCFEGYPYGPAFGSGHDLLVHGTKVYLNTGNSYHCDKDRKMTGGCHWPITEIEVFQVVPKLYPSKIGKGNLNIQKATTFSKTVNDAINEKWISLKEFEGELVDLEEHFKDEETFISSFGSGKPQDVVVLNVSGTMMAACRSTLQLCENSELASQFALPETAQENDYENTIENWDSKDVLAWLNGLGGISESTLKSFEENEVSGRELLALGKEGLLDFGVKKGKVYLILEEIRKVRTATKNSSTFIDHSSYCFEKILDFLRMKKSLVRCLVEDEVKPPDVRESESARFQKVVKHFFPGDSSKFILESGKI